jgi:transposase-like protein
MIALLNQIPSETKIVALLRHIRFGKNLSCPRCRSRAVYRSEGRYRCVRCRRPFTLLTGTWLAGTKLSLRTLWALLWCWVNRVPVLQTEKLTHVGEEAVYRWFRLFRLQLPDFQPILAGKVQMDEAYFRRLSLLMAKQVGSRSVAHQVLGKPSVDKRDATQFLFQHVAPNARLQTDGAGIYRAIERWWQVEHRVDIHKKFQFAHTSEIEGMFGNLRTFIRRMYHHNRPEFLPEYVTEFCLRFSSPEIFESPLTFLQKTLNSVPTD